MPFFRLFSLCAVITLGCTTAQAASLTLTKVNLTGVSMTPKTDLDAPVGGPTDTYYLVDLESGRIDRVTNGVAAATPFLTNVVSSAVPRLRVFGMAFHPDYANNGKVYVTYSENFGANVSGNQIVVEYTRSAADPNVLDPTPKTIFKQSHGPKHPTSAGRHGASDIGFGPDGMLYITTGDAGGSITGDNPAFDLNDKSGKVLRIDVNGDDFPNDPERNYAIPADNPFAGQAGNGVDEAIWAYGLRNPFRANFDPLTGTYYIGDVGESTQEEINVGVSGANYGWNFREGFGDGPNLVPGTGPFEDPIYAYDHGSGPYDGVAVIGGIVYRGLIPQLYGEYLFADFADWYTDQVVDQIWSFNVDDPAGPLATRKRWKINTGNDTLSAVNSFSVGPDGTAYILDYDGEVYAITAAVVPVPLSLLSLSGGLGLLWLNRRRTQRVRKTTG